MQYYHTPFHPLTPHFILSHPIPSSHTPLHPLTPHSILSPSSRTPLHPLTPHFILSHPTPSSHTPFKPLTFLYTRCQGGEGIFAFFTMHAATLSELVENNIKRGSPPSSQNNRSSNTLEDGSADSKETQGRYTATPTSTPTSTSTRQHKRKLQRSQSMPARHAVLTMYVNTSFSILYLCLLHHSSISLYICLLHHSSISLYLCLLHHSSIPLYLCLLHHSSISLYLCLL